MSPKFYDRLSTVYDAVWGGYSSNYTPLIQQLLRDRGIKYARVLDLACGTGTLALELGKKGHAVYGVDISEPMIRIARRKAQLLDNVRFAVHDMLSFSHPDLFDLVCCTIDSLNYVLSERAMTRFFTKVRELLKQGGLFVFDVNTDAMYTSRHDDVITHTFNGKSFVQRLTFDRNTGAATAIFEFPGGEIEIHKQMPYSYATIRKILRQTGMRMIRKYSDFSGTRFRKGDERLICVAMRR